jgi:hypothetical protein
MHKLTASLFFVAPNRFCATALQPGSSLSGLNIPPRAYKFVTLSSYVPLQPIMYV